MSRFDSALYMLLWLVGLIIACSLLQGSVKDPEFFQRIPKFSAVCIMLGKGFIRGVFFKLVLDSMHGCVHHGKRLYNGV